MDACSDRGLTDDIQKLGVLTARLVHKLVASQTVCSSQHKVGCDLLASAQDNAWPRLVEPAGRAF